MLRGTILKDESISCPHSIRQYNESWVIEHIPNIENLTDLLGQDSNGITSDCSALFYFLPRLFGRLLKNDPKAVLSKNSILFRRKYIHNIILRIGPLFLNGKKLIREKLAPLPSGRPLIFAPNHGFIQDPMCSVLMAERHAYLLFGSLPQFFNTFNGVAAYLNGVIFINRKNKDSRQASIEKAVHTLRLGTNLIIYPEGVINKTPNQLTLPYWPGIIKVAKKANALIIPIVHLLSGEEIHSSRLDAFDATLYNDDNTQQALIDLQTIVNTELWNLMEKYACTLRTGILEGHDTMADACESIVRRQVGTLGRFYDCSIECSADYRDKSRTREADIWRPVAQLELTPQNAATVMFARERVRILDKEDYQRRF